MYQNQGFPSGMGKTPHDRHRSVSRPSPYHVQSSRSNSLSLKCVTVTPWLLAVSDTLYRSEDEELMSSYNSAGQPGYQPPWGGATGLIAGDMGQMTLEHRRCVMASLYASSPFRGWRIRASVT